MKQINTSVTGKRYTVPELAEATKMSRAFWRKVIFLGRIEVECYGRSVRVSQEALETYLADRTTHVERTEAA